MIMYPQPSNPMSLILDEFDRLGITIGDIVLELLTSGDRHLAVESIFINLEKILEALVRHSERTQQIINQWSFLNTTNVLRDEMCILTLKETGFHFSARTTTEMKLKDFDIQVMSNEIQRILLQFCEFF